ncbi:MAG: DUF1616 domain-containing protein [Chloroflexi bacterium]|nr:DUF1616 domain-containing protein [Chloroflexota bacterium]
MNGQSRRLIARFLFIVAAVALLLPGAGCVAMADIANIKDGATDPAGPLGGTRVVGQTFVSHQAGLSAVQVLPIIGDAAPLPHNEILTLHLRTSPDDVGPDLRSVGVRVADLRHNVPQRFEFPPIFDSKDKSFYFFLEIKGISTDGGASVWSSEKDTYPYGSMYLDGHQTTGDLTFRTFYVYDAATMAGDLARGVTGNWGAILLAIVVLLMPGYILHFLYPRRSRLDPVEVLALSVGLSIAVLGAVALFAKLMGIKLDETNVRVAAVMLGTVATVLLLKGMIGRSLRQVGASERSSPMLSGTSAAASDGIEAWPYKEKLLFYICMALVLLVSAAIRFVHVRDATVPMWVDSPQHAEIVQLIVGNGGLPDSYRPFAEVEPFSYHFGFHVLVALFHWLSGMDVPGSMLVIGQALSVLIPLSVYMFAVKLSRSRLVALVSATVVGLISVMPAYYVSWGRYTQLTGMVLLPIAVALTMEALSTPRSVPPLRPLLLAAIAVGGLIIAHPRVMVFYLCFLLAFTGQRIVTSRHSWQSVAQSVSGTAILGGAGAAIVLPWIWTILRSIVLRTWQGASQATAADNPFPFAFITASNDRALIATAVGGLALGLIMRRKGALLLAVWTGLMLLSANLEMIGLRGSTMVSNGAVAIALFLPISLLVGYLISGTADHLGGVRWPFAIKLAAAVALIAVGLYGARGLLGILNPGTYLFFAEDRRAMDWIARNTPTDAKLLINSSFWQYGMYVGSDGGYWIPALTGRRTTVPTLLYALGKPSYLRNTSSRIAEAEALASSDRREDLRRYIEDNGVTYVYIGYRGGVMDPNLFLDTRGYREVYRKDGVWIFKVVQAE